MRKTEIFQTPRSALAQYSRSTSLPMVTRSPHLLLFVGRLVTSLRKPSFGNSADLARISPKLASFSQISSICLITSRQVTSGFGSPTLPALNRRWACLPKRYGGRLATTPPWRPSRRSRRWRRRCSARSRLPVFLAGLVTQAVSFLTAPVIPSFLTNLLSQGVAHDAVGPFLPSAQSP
jgi:hypothetical protein